MRRRAKYILPLLTALLFIVGCPTRDPYLPPFSETYRFNDKNPFGGYVAYQTLYGAFDNVEEIATPAFNLDQDIKVHKQNGQHSLYVIIADAFHPPSYDEKWLVNYVESGNELFLSANHISLSFLERFTVGTNQIAANANEHWGKMEDTDVRIVFGKDLPELSYRYFYFPFKHSFVTMDERQARTLGTDSHNRPNFIVVFLGKGRLYLHLAPRSLGNYFLLTDSNIEYLRHITEYFKQDPVAVYWDEYYKRGVFGNADKEKEKENFSALSVIMSHPALKWAFLLAFAALLLFIFSNSKRKQRCIPVRPPTDNASVDFIETVARLYLVNKDNKNIAQKLVSYFYDYIRSRFHMQPEMTERFAARLAGKKGLPVTQVAELLETIRLAEESYELSDAQLLDLNKQLEDFYNNT